MTKSYHFILNKSISALLTVAFLLFPIMPAQAKIPTDPRYGEQAVFYKQIQAPQAWDISTGSKQVIVAIIDTGADIWHEDLRDNLWINSGEIPDNGVDDDGNGFADDINGWNFVEQNNVVRPSVFEVKDDPDAVHHGTVIAGLIGAGSNGLGGVGLNWQVKIMPIRAMSSDGSGTLENVAKAVDYAVMNGADVINLSVVTDINDAYLASRVRAAYLSGVVVVAAVGNNGLSTNADPVYPACADQEDSSNWILGVASVGTTDKLNLFSNYGNCADIAAPGTGLMSTERFAPEYNYPENFGGPWNGTSFATSLVTGAAALIKSVRPEWGAKEIITALLTTADSIDSRATSTLGRLNVGRAVTMSYIKRADGPIMNNFFYISGKRVMSYNFTQNKLRAVSSYNDATIADYALADTNSNGKADMVILIKRGKYYYVVKVPDNGRMEEWSVPTECYPNKKDELRKISWLVENDEPKIVVSGYLSTKKSTAFNLFNLEGDKLTTLTLSGDYPVFAPVGGGVAVSKTVKNNKSEITVFDWSKKVVAKRTEIGTISALIAGELWWGGEQLLAAVTNKGKTQGLVWDWASDSYRKGEIQAPVGAKLGLIQHNAIDGLEVAVFNSKNNTINIYSGRLEMVERVRVK